MAEGGGTDSHLDNLDGNSSHYVIKYSGELVQMVPEGMAAGSMNPKRLRTTDDAPFTNYEGLRVRYGITALKASIGMWYVDPNRVSIAIEIEGFAGSNTSIASDPRGGPNDAQEKTLVALVSDIRRRRGHIPAFGHRDAQSYKACPGRRIPWKALGGHAVIPVVISKEPDMQSFNILPGAVDGSLTVKADAGHYYLLLSDGTLHGPVNPVTWGVKSPAFGPVRLLVPIPGGAAGEDRATGYLIGYEAAFFLAKDVVFKPTPPPLDTTPFSQAQVDAARAAGVTAGRLQIKAEVQKLP